MPIIDQSEKKDIVILGSSENYLPNFHVVHGKSGESASVTLDKLQGIKSGDVITGDFNINFLIKDNLTALNNWLVKNKLYMEMSPASIAQLVVYLKIRSTNSLYSQQLLKNGLIDVFIKDLPPFKVLDNKDGRAAIPAELTDALASLSLKAKTVENQITDPSDFQAINTICKEAGVISYHDLEQSHGNDHPYMYYVDEENNRIILIQNSIEHTDYDLVAHFKNPVDSNVSEALYLQYDGVVWSEFYKLLAKRDNTPLSVWNKVHQLLNKQEKTRAEVNLIKEACMEKLKEKTLTKNKATIKVQGPNSGSLTKEDIKEYYNNVLKSTELKQINQLLMTPFDLDSAEGIDKYMAILVSDKNFDKYKTKISGVLTAVYQGLNPDFPKKDEQTVALNGTGFLPFVRANGDVIPAEEIHAIQFKKLEELIQSLHNQYPKAEINLALIEGQDKGVRQEPKCNNLTSALNSINECIGMPQLVNLTPRDNTDWNFWLTTGIVLGASLSVASFAVAALAIAAVIAIPVAGIIAIATVGAVATGLSIYGMFQYKEDLVFSEPSAEITPEVTLG